MALSRGGRESSSQMPFASSSPASVGELGDTAWTLPASPSSVFALRARGAAQAPSVDGGAGRERAPRSRGARPAG